MNAPFNVTIAKIAVMMAVPSIRAAMDAYMFKRTCLHIVVADRRTYSPGAEFEPIYRFTVGIETDDWKNREHPFDEIAFAKARASWRTGFPMSYLLYIAPQLLLPGDPRYIGSDVLGNIVVGCSGVEGYHDEGTSHQICGNIRALCKRFVEEIRPPSVDFF